MSPPRWKIKVVEPISLKPEAERRRALVPGLRMTYEPAELRFFQARFEPLAAFLAPTPEQPLQRPFAADRTQAVHR